MKLKIGFIGCGEIAARKYFPALTENADLCEMVAFCDITEARAAKAAKTHGTAAAKVYTDYKELLCDKAVDVVYVLTPNVTHAPITIAAFQADKHVMCDKPMATNTEDAEHMMAAWKKSGRQFTVAYQNRFRPEVQSLYRACRAGELGDIYLAKAIAIRRRGIPTWGMFLDKSLQGGGPLIDIGTHSLDMTLWLMDNYEPHSVTGSTFQKLGRDPAAVEGNLFGPWDTSTYELEDAAFGFIKMKNGATVIVESAWALNVLESRSAATTLCGTKAGAEIRSGISFPKPELIFNRGAYGQLLDETTSTGGMSSYYGETSEDPGIIEARQWLKACLGEGEPLVKPEQAFMVTRLVDAIYQSAETGREVLF
ncbi:MAG: Gfo/Idh/MocA family oxidoreductase [Oscillospiraceae bacterium]|nr:Gfo/Idh/MocA family oxidoreductase [Oscillospiraceae bacterium]